ncbi:putative N(4)-(Beta-N-acetylglucosaminyl)-L-asparaginase [Halotydeus destructor]|nr:putative N(4)-(Beta-N-acetylglucosaminyl)-L-asparaginase [Halotydeus destructor]
MLGKSLVLLVPLICVVNCSGWPLVINTWNFTNACDSAWKVVAIKNGSALDGIEMGIRRCEIDQCHGSVGWGNKPSESGETTLDAMIMDGPTHDVGAVGGLRRIRPAISVARRVLENTNHSLLVGDLATKFALEMGFKEESLSSNQSRDEWQRWTNADCQPNFWRNVQPDPRASCGPYSSVSNLVSKPGHSSEHRDFKDHDTIGMVVIDREGRMAVGTSTNGLVHKVAGRVGDSPIPGSGSYVDQEVGGAACTGDGDVMMRFVPSYHAVELMRNGWTPKDAADDAILRIAKRYPSFTGAIVVADISGDYGASCWGLGGFQYAVGNPTLGGATLKETPCLDQ